MFWGFWCSQQTEEERISRPRLPLSCAPHILTPYSSNMEAWSVTLKPQTMTFYTLSLACEGLRGIIRNN